MIGASKKYIGLHRQDKPEKRLALAKALWGWEPHKVQRPWVMDTSDIKAAACGRRWGKTESAIVDDLTFAIAHKGTETMVVAPSRDQVMLLFRPAKDLLESTPELEGAYHTRETPHPEITIGAGKDASYIRYRTAGEDGKFLRGYGLHRCRVDEAGYVKGAIITDVIQPQLGDYDGQLICQGTPFGKNWFYDFFERGQRECYGRYRSYRFPSSSNPHLPADYLVAMEEELGADSLCWRAEYLAEFIDSMGSVFPWEQIQGCLYDHLQAPPSFGQYLAGADIAMYSDYSAVIVGGHDRGLLYVVDWDRFNRVDWTQQKTKLYDIITRYDAITAIDATHGSAGDPVAFDLMTGEWIEAEDGHIRQRDGLRIEQYDFRSTNKMELIKKVQIKLAHRMLRIPYAFRELIDEMKYYGFENTASGNVKFSAIGNHHDDCVCALALMVRLLYGNHEKQFEEQGYPVGSLGRLLEQLDAEERQGGGMIIQPANTYTRL